MITHLRKFSIFLLLVAPQVLMVAHAERADRRKPAVVDAGDYSGDNKSKQLQLRKGVTITQGTLKIIADNGDLKGDAGTYQASLKGEPVCFRQKKDGSDEILRGQSLRVEYDQAKEKVEFFNKVVVHDGINELRGDYIVYYMATEKFEVRDKSPKGAARIVMMPKEADVADDPTKDTQANAAPKPRLKTSKEIEVGRYEPLASKCLKETL